MARLQGKTTIITGAGRGIGRKIALAFAKEAANVVLVSRSGNQLEETASLISSARGKRRGRADGRKDKGRIRSDGACVLLSPTVQ